ncbi:MAG TPA: STAS domain-containing protein [Cyclobacteriaceae bacterium]|nr:STAS domain-containing protein [Cyclobacteriaceae bacterium]
MKFDIEVKSDLLIIKLTGDLIGEDSGLSLLEKASNAINEGVRNCLINISGLRYINSSGIGVLITILTKFRNKGGEMFLMNPSESVQKLLIITKLNAIFQVVDSEDTARKLIANQ